MKKLFKKTLAIALVATLIFGAGPVAGLCGFELPSVKSFIASAVEEEPVWTVATDDMLVIEGNTITGYTESLSGNIEIPSRTSSGTAITKIASSAFKDCSSLTAVKIPETIISIEWDAFRNTGLETVYFNATSCSFSGTTTFSDNGSLTKFVFGENVTQIPGYICTGVTSLQSVEFNGKVTGIGNNSFKECSSLEAIDLSDVTEIGQNAFVGCTTLKATDKALATNEDKGTIVFSDGLLTIGSWAFENCTAIKEVTIPKNVNSIGYDAFRNTGLETVYFNATSCSFSGTTTFSDNGSLTKFVFGENVTQIPGYICTGVTSLQSVEFNGKVTGIGNNSFKDCFSLADVYYNAGSEGDWKNVKINSGNDILSSDNVTIHFGIYPMTYNSDSSFDVTVSCNSKTFSQEVKLSVSNVEGERQPGSIYISDNEIREQISCFNIKMILADGSSTAAVQPNGIVTVKMAIPENYIGKTNYKIVHRLDNEGKTRETFSTTPKTGEKKLSVSSDGKYWIFDVTSFSKFEFFAIEAVPTVSIKNNSGSATINYGETLSLTAITTNMPADAKIVWYVDGMKKGEGTTFNITPESGSVNVTVKIVDKDGNESYGSSVSDSQTVTVKSGFFQKLISFFKNLFGLNRVIIQSLNLK